MRRLLYIPALLILLTPLVSHAAVVTFLTSGVSYSTPGDWNNSDNSIECIGAGGNGGTADAGGGGGGGGAYAKIVNLTIAGSIPYSVASGGSQADTTFNTTSLVCDAGNNAVTTTGGTGGTTAASTGTTEFAGGAGFSGGAGGGAGGTTGAGADGTNFSGGNGGSVSGGVGGTSSGITDVIGGAGGDGTVWQVSPARGAGGGGGAGAPGEQDGGCVANGTDGGNGGNFGGGGGGGGPDGPVACEPGAGGLGTPGIITVTYTPLSVSVAGSGKLAPGGSFRIVGGKLKIQ